MAIYSIRCKKEFIHAWPQKLKDGLQGFATVEIVYPDSKRTLPLEIDRISSPQGGHTVFINKNEITDPDFIKAISNPEYGNFYTAVEVVSEGGDILLCTSFSIDSGEYSIHFHEGKVVKKQEYAELHKRITSVLQNMSE